MPLYDPTIWDEEQAKLLLSVMLAANTRAQAKTILGDLLTEKEIKDLSQRVYIAKCLQQGDSYTTIQSKCGASAATIAQISKWVNEGGGGYKLMLNLLDE